MKRRKAKLKGFYGFLKHLSGLLLWLFGIKVEGAENEPLAEEGAYLMCANHINALDPFFIAAALWQHPLHYMAKKELFKNKLFAAFFRSLGAYPIDRSGADVGAVKETIKMLREGKCTALFPQGTRHKGVHPSGTRIKPGAGLIAAKAQVPVLPVLIQSKDWRVGFRHRTKIIIGKPILPEEYLPAGDAAHINYTQVTQVIFDRICALEDREWK